MLSGIISLILLVSSSSACLAKGVVGEASAVRSGSISTIATMGKSRAAHSSTLLANGRVLVAGGFAGGENGMSDAEIYDPVTNTFTPTGSMNSPRESHTATLLKDGRVLITGGHKDRRAAITIYSSTEIYDPAKGTFTPTADLTVRRHKHDAILMDDGQVLIVGGSDERDSRGAYTTVEIYDPTTNRTSRVGDMNVSRYKLQGTTIRLPNGRILIAGGSTQAEIYDPRSNSFIVARGRFESTRLFSTATLLPSGDVVIIGGYDDALASSSKAWVYKETK